MLVKPDEIWRQIETQYSDEYHAIQLLIEQMQSLVSVADREGDIPVSSWQKLPCSLLNRFNVPMEYGGPKVTGSAIRRVVVMEKVGRICPSMPIGMPGPGLSMPPVYSLGTEEQRNNFFSRFLNSESPLWGAFAITEPSAGSDATAIKTTAIKDGENYILNGEKCFISCGGRADVVVAFASINPEKGRFGIRAFIVDANTPGFNVDRLEDMMGLRFTQLATLSFNDCKIHQSQMLGHNGKRGPLIDAFAGAQGAWDYMRPAISACMNGASAGILDYVEQQMQNGLIIPSSNDLKSFYHRLNVYKNQVKSALLLTYRAAWKYDQGKQTSLDASLAKACSSSLAMEVAHWLCSSFPEKSIESGNRIEKFYRDAKAFNIIEGTGDMQRMLISKAYS